MNKVDNTLYWYLRRGLFVSKDASRIVSFLLDNIFSPFGEKNSKRSVSLINLKLGVGLENNYNSTNNAVFTRSNKIGRFKWIRTEDCTRKESNKKDCRKKKIIH